MSTIVALSTPRGRGALAVVRISGSEALRIANELIVGGADLQSRLATFHKIKSGSRNEILDEVVVTGYRAPASVTGEDVVEISCHGSPAIVQQLIDMILDCGAELAAPGEFSLRALLNGKINLSQAEAIRDLIASQTNAAVRQASRQLNGELSNALEPFKQNLIEIIVLLESALEFVEDDLPDLQLKAISEKLQQVIHDVDRLAASFRAGRLLQEGAKVTIVGAPNVGKSSVFNMLVSQARAIVTDLPGTTRDTLTESIDLEGIPIALTDTAGLRDTVDRVEGLGIERTRQAMAEADVLLLVVDGSIPISEQDLDYVSSTDSARTLIVANKSDLPGFDLDQEALRPKSPISLSTRTQMGLDALRAAILGALTDSDIDSGSLIITNARHHRLLCQSSAELGFAVTLLLERRSEELVLVPLQNALRLLGEITGETTTEDILSEIFATFCIGK